MTGIDVRCEIEPYSMEPAIVIKLSGHEAIDNFSEICFMLDKKMRKALDDVNTGYGYLSEMAAVLDECEKVQKEFQELKGGPNE